MPPSNDPLTVIAFEVDTVTGTSATALEGDEEVFVATGDIV